MATVRCAREVPGQTGSRARDTKEIADLRAVAGLPRLREFHPTVSRPWVRNWFGIRVARGRRAGGLQLDPRPPGSPPHRRTDPSQVGRGATLGRRANRARGAVAGSRPTAASSRAVARARRPAQGAPGTDRGTHRRRRGRAPRASPGTRTRPATRLLARSRSSFVAPPLRPPCVTPSDSRSEEGNPSRSIGRVPLRSGTTSSCYPRST